jgi:hypothetical protein
MLLDKATVRDFDATCLTVVEKLRSARQDVISFFADGVLRDSV